MQQVQQQEVGLAAFVGRGGQKQHVGATARKDLAELIPLGLAQFLSVARGGKLVRLVDDQQVPAALAQELAKVFLASVLENQTHAVAAALLDYAVNLGHPIFRDYADALARLKFKSPFAAFPRKPPTPNITRPIAG
ncbi:MAG: hypothetical protein ACUVUC_14095 [Thermoguttaceae bacterium]